MKHYQHHLYRGLGLVAIFITKSRTAHVVIDITRNTQFRKDFLLRGLATNP